MEKEFDFFSDHSEAFLEMAFCPDYLEIPAHPDGRGKNTGECGDTVEVFLSVARGRIEEISFRIDGCINTRACANTIGRMTYTKPLEQAWTIAPRDVIDYLQTLPESSHHCAELACGALYRALAHARTNIRDPWKKNYTSR
jgi:nitrogen fixation NifU-like protein